MCRLPKRTKTKTNGSKKANPITAEQIWFNKKDSIERRLNSLNNYLGVECLSNKDQSVLCRKLVSCFTENLLKLNFNINHIEFAFKREQSLITKQLAERPPKEFYKEAVKAEGVGV